MSSFSDKSTDDGEMTRIIKELLNELHYLSILKNEKAYGFYNAERLYKLVYEFGRYTHLCPNYRQLMTDEHKTTLKQFFPMGFAKLVDYTPGLICNIEPANLNFARTRQSQICFLKNEVLQCYKEVNEGELPKEVTDALAKLQESVRELSFDIANWTRPDYSEAEDDLDEVPNLNGVPQSHNWWTEEHREMWRSRKE